MNKICIIGGGIAGLSAANYLAEKKISTVLIEANNFGRDKVCGEFFSPEVVDILKKWDLPLALINKANFITNRKKYFFYFDKPAGSISRALSEKLLAQRASENGVIILTDTKVVELIPPLTESMQYRIILSNGQTVVADSLIVAAGRLPFVSYASFNQNAPKFIGIKAHFQNFPVEDNLYMYITPNAYMGITSIEGGKTNISCLAKRNIVEYSGGAHTFIQNLIENIPCLKEQIYNARCLYENWLISPIPFFGKKKVPNWPNSYFIGDAAASIHPAAGNGLAMAVTSGIMAAHYAINKSSNNFRQAWEERYSKRIRWAKILHSIFIRPRLANKAFFCANLFPNLANAFYKNTREEII